MENFTPTDAIALQGNRGYADGMWGGEWFWIIIILFFCWGGNGFGRNEQVDIDTRFLERDIFNTNQNVSTSACQTQRDVLESKYDLGTQVLENRFNCSQNACETQKEILQNRYDNALQTQTLSAQMAECCCNLRAEGLANTQKILDKMCENEINQLRTDLQSAQLQISQLSQTANITNTLRPFPVPAYITYSPYQSSYNGYGCGCANTTIV